MAARPGQRLRVETGLVLVMYVAHGQDPGLERWTQPKSCLMRERVGGVAQLAFGEVEGE